MARGFCASLAILASEICESTGGFQIVYKTKHDEIESKRAEFKTSAVINIMYIIYRPKKEL